ncbi:MAG: phage tail protein [Saprospiraceae bacterium]|nr:phage tail protein [Saprospiraceae bacterium]
MLGALGSLVTTISDFINDPIPSFYFGVSIVDSTPESFLGAIGGAGASSVIQALDPVATAFTEVSGLEMGLDSGSVTWEEGGNSVPIKLPGRLKNDVITLKRYLRPRHIAVGGFSLDPLTGWASETFERARYWSDKLVVKDLYIVVYHPQVKNPIPVGPSALPIAGYHVQGAYPTKWSMSDLSSTNESDPITETFEFTYQDMDRIKVDLPF